MAAIRRRKIFQYVIFNRTKQTTAKIREARFQHSLSFAKEKVVLKNEGKKNA